MTPTTNLAPNRLPCLVLMMDAGMNLQISNQGYGKVPNPLTLQILTGNDIFCSKEAADAVAARISADTGLTLVAELPFTMGTFSYVGLVGEGDATYGVEDPTDPTTIGRVNEYILYNTAITPKGAGADVGNAEGMLNLMAEFTERHWVFTEKYLDPPSGRPTLRSFKGPVLQYVGNAK